MLYLIYKTTNDLTGSYYIGQYQTKNEDDGYLGSGKILKRAIDKYGRDSFSREILHYCSSHEEMCLLESQLVTAETCSDPLCYNICPGGLGGFGYINSNNIHSTEAMVAYAKTDAGRQKSREAMTAINADQDCRDKRVRTMYDRYGSEAFATMKGKNHSQSSKEAIGFANKKMVGEKNSQYGTCWVINDGPAIKIPLDALPRYVSDGYRRGRK